MKLLSWNVNGIRAAIRKGFIETISEESPDIICVQETKARPEDVNLDLPGYEQFWNSAQKKGYSGTAVFTRIKPLAVLYGMGKEEHDAEGRLITLEFPDHFLVCVYTPNAQHGLKRLPYRIVWDRDFLDFVKHLDSMKPVIITGDLNVAHEEIDLANPDRNHENPGFSDDERRDFSAILEAGFVDTFRYFTKDPGHYTWWSYRFNSRARNIGWRIDYVCVSQKLLPKVHEAFILPEVMGSDHCPVAILYS